MALLSKTQESYYNLTQSFTGDDSTKIFTLTVSYFNPLPNYETEFDVFINDTQISKSNYTYSSPNLTFIATDYNSDVQESDGAPKDGLTVLVKQTTATEQYGNYQYVKLKDIINNFLISYIGQDKIITKVPRALVSFHAQRGLAEMSYDIFKSEKSQEIEIPSTLQMILPHDYVNYVKVTWAEGDTGIEHIIYPARKTSNPRALLQDSNYNYIFDETNGEILYANESETWGKYKNNNEEDATNTKVSREDLMELNIGQRYGLDPQYSQNNGSFFIDDVSGKIFFSSNLSQKIVTLKYISDSLGTESEMRVHKLAEEAMYKYIAHAILATRANIPPVIVQQYKRERFVEMRKAKLRLSNIKSEELAQIMRGKSKHIKH
tara:strand:+ start:6063 stop:7193 length:1131 start_codon:yes stop_codon:yes gene_type:complete